MNNNLFKINKINNDQKKVFINRFLMASFIFFYWIILFSFCLATDNSISSDWYIKLPLWSKGVFAYFFIILLVPFILGSSYEINKLFFGIHSKNTLFLLFFCMVIFCILPNFTYITKFYYFSTILKTTSGISPDYFSTIFSLFTLTLFISFFILIIILIFIIKRKGINDLATLLSFSILTIIISFGFFSIGFIGLLKTWLVLFFIIAISSFTDIFAYLSGLIFGKRKLSKIISPKKTVEGFYIGLTITIFCGLLLTYFISFGEENHSSFENLVHIHNIYANVYSRWFFMLFLIILLSLFSSLGDLTFSYVKRRYGIKDYGTFFQTHGGILDRFDSILFSTSIYTLLLFLLSGISDSKLFG